MLELYVVISVTPLTSDICEPAFPEHLLCARNLVLRGMYMLHVTDAETESQAPQSLLLVVPHCVLT